MQLWSIFITLERSLQYVYNEFGTVPTHPPVRLIVYFTELRLPYRPQITLKRKRGLDFQ